MKLLNLKTNEQIDLAQLYLSLSADGNYHGSPKVELDYLKNRVLVKEYISSNEIMNPADLIKKSPIKTIAEYKIEDGILIFYYWK